MIENIKGYFAFLVFVAICVGMAYLEAADIKEKVSLQQFKDSVMAQSKVIQNK